MIRKASSTGKPRRRWLQYSLRTLLVFMLLIASLAAWLGWELDQGRRQKVAIDWVREQEGNVHYMTDAEVPWQQLIFGTWYPQRVTHIDLGDTSLDDPRPLAAFSDLEVLLLDGTAVADLSPLAHHSRLRFLDVTGIPASEEEIAALQRRLPQLIVWQQPEEGGYWGISVTNYEKITVFDRHQHELWSITLAEQLPDPAWGHIAICGDRLIWHKDGAIYALDHEDGHELWRQEIDCRCVGATDELVLALQNIEAGESAESGTWAVALDPLTGDEISRTHLPGNILSEWLYPVDDFIVIEGQTPAGAKFSDIIDSRGRRRCRIAGDCNMVLPQGNELILQTDTKLMRISAKEQEIWSAVCGWPAVFQTSRPFELPDGDLIILNYSYTPRSGVNVLRLNPQSGAVLWSATCAGRRFEHATEYQDAYIVPGRSALAVLSIHAWGHLVELLDPDTGASLGRWDFRERIRPDQSRKP